MEEKSILIRFRTEFKKAALNALKGGLNEIMSLARGATGAFSNLTRGFASIPGAIKTASLNLMGWNNIFGRVTIGMLTWQAWRTVVNGFQEIADAMVGANMRMQSARQMFTALSGGMEETGQLYIDILRDMSVQTGVSFDKLMENARRLPTQVGQNFAAFSELTRKAIVLGMLDPIQGVEGAFYALTNFLEGTAQGARSLVQRFELFSMGQVKRALEEAANPVEALDILFKEAGIDVDIMIDKLQNSLPVALSGITSMFKEFLRIVGEPTIAKATEDFIRLRDWMRENQDAIQGLGQALGEGIEGGFTRLRNFIGDILGLDEFDPMQFFDAGVELMTNLADGMFTALTDYVLPTIVNIAEAIASFFIGASPPSMGPLRLIREGGRETIKQYVLGLSEGLSSSALKAMAQNIIDNIIGLEAQEIAQEKSIKQIESWVDQAEKATQSARDRLRLFDIQTADVPERFTRARRRELELAILRAEQEERRRKEALEAAREQLKMLREHLKAQRQILQLLERQAKAREKEEKAAEETKKALDRSFQMPEGFDAEGFKARVEEWKQIFKGKLEPLFAEFREGFGDLADFVRGLFGADPDAVRGFTEMYETGQRLRTAILQIKDAMDQAWGTISETLKGASETWQGLDPGFRKLILAIIGGLMFPKLALLAGLTLSLNDPGNIKGLLVLLLGMVGTAPGLLTLVVNLVGVAKGALGLLIPFIGAAGLPLILPLVLLAEIYLGREELSRWISGERVKELKAIINILGFKGAALEIWEGFGEHVTHDVLGMSEEQQRSLGDWLSRTAENLGLTFGQDLTSASQDAITSAEGDMESATDKGVKKPIVKVFQDLFDRIVGRSIVPDMLRRIVEEFARFPGRLVPYLQALMNLLVAVMEQIKMRWAADWNQMVMVASSSLRAISAIQSQISQIQLGISQTLMPPAPSLSGATAQAQTQMSAFADMLSSLPFGSQFAESLNGTIQLDGAATTALLQGELANFILSLPAE